MCAHRTRLLKPAQGWLVACVMTSLVVLMSVSGEDVFARHVGMSISASATPNKAVDLGRSPASPDTLPGTGDDASALSGHSDGDGGGAAHLLHLLGACLAILCAGAAFRHRRGWLPWSPRATVALSPRLVCAASWLAGLRRGPPRLAPPRFSPVIRT